jgi:hypothetical protein
VALFSKLPFFGYCFAGRMESHGSQIFTNVQNFPMPGQPQNQIVIHRVVKTYIDATYIKKSFTVEERGGLYGYLATV